ncbi:MAG: patatin-like phospholipase family protein [Alphaproteobacteria bacterium]|nr:MAG: patatin-like phospholipase family protein [Alphaproteobacteria bacterium]
MTNPVPTGASALLSALDIWSTGPAAPPVQAKAPAIAPQPPVSAATEARRPEPSVQPAVTASIATEAKLPEPASPPAADAKRMGLSARLAAVGSAASYRQYTTVAAPRAWPPRNLSLALQGGGSFGAFTWGVLDRLLDEGECNLDAISGASVGAVNAVLLACGLAEGGRSGAQSRLKRFWTRMTNDASFRALMLVGGFSPAGSSVAFGPALRSGQFDPFDLDPLRQVLAQEIDFSALRRPDCPRLLVAATRVRDGKLQIFRNRDITADVVLASTCPPLVHCAVEIEGCSYWDGGYAANPPVVRLVHESNATDLLVVQITPARDRYIPMTMAAIDRRLDQITANSTLNAEIAALELQRDVAATPLRVSRIAAEDEIDGLAQRSPVDLGRNFIEMLHRSGRAAADRWLKQGAVPRPPAIQEMPAGFGASLARHSLKETSLKETSLKETSLKETLEA